MFFVGFNVVLWGWNLSKWVVIYDRKEFVYFVNYLLFVVFDMVYVIFNLED